MFSLKNFACIKFVTIALVFNFAIFPKIATLKSVWVYDSYSVCVCVCVCVYVCKNTANQNNVIVATCKTQHGVLLFEMWRNFKSSLTEKLKKLSLIHDAKFYLLKMLLHSLVDKKVVYIKTVMQTHFYMHCLLILLCQMVT